jgi:hypothetical protein
MSMSASAPLSGTHRPQVESDRFRLAIIARDAALAVPGVVATDPGPQNVWVTGDHGERVEGVMCVAAAAGGYDISLRLKCELVPLLSLGSTVAETVRRAAGGGGYRVDDLRVEIADVAEPAGL